MHCVQLFEILNAFYFAFIEFGHVVNLSFVGSLRDSVVNGNLQSVRQFLAAETDPLSARPVPSKERQPVHDNMTLVMLAARHGQCYGVNIILP